MMNADMDAVDAENQVELEEKTRLINQVLELQHTLEEKSVTYCILTYSVFPPDTWVLVLLNARVLTCNHVHCCFCCRCAVVRCVDGDDFAPALQDLYLLDF
ncbi:short coiled-coil protein isoform X1 [Microtus pennsylvanicus]|uniref:short coiled-coil protein isoform X1 n=1 Tax=Microtus pennsylvanicus TaxID=10058 RepID=UPI003F6CB286